MAINFFIPKQNAINKRYKQTKMYQHSESKHDSNGIAIERTHRIHCEILNASK